MAEQIDSVKIKRYRIACFIFLVSCWLLFDLFLDLLCARIPLFIYLVAAGLGYALGGPLSGFLDRPGHLHRVIRGFGITVSGLGAVAFLLLLFNPVQWGTKCSWRSCARVLGPGLFVSPFPSKGIGCADLSRCVNEYPFSVSELERIYKLIEDKGCPPP